MSFLEEVQNNVNTHNKSLQQQEHESVIELINEYTTIAKEMIQERSKKGKSETTVLMYYVSPFDFKNEYNNPKIHTAEQVIYRVSREIKSLGFKTNVYHNPALFLFGLEIKW